MKYKIGDKVRVVSLPEGCEYNSSMQETIGKICEIKNIYNDLICHYEIYQSDRKEYWWFREENLEPVRKPNKLLKRIKELEKRVEELENANKTVKEIVNNSQPSKKITLKEFFESKEKLAIHCDTESKANELLKAFDKIGKKWDDNKSYLNENNWNEYEEETCYTNYNLYGNRDFYKDIGCSIYEFEEIDLTIPQVDLLTEDEKVILRNIDKKYKWIARDKSGTLVLFFEKPYKKGNLWGGDIGYSDIEYFYHLFQFIKWSDEEPYKISKLLGE